MKKLVVSIALILGLAMSIYGQTSNECKSYGHEKSYVHSIGKGGIKSNKDCLRVTICPNAIEFRATATSVMTMYKISDSKWETEGGKVVNVSVQSDGRIAYWVGEKKAYVVMP